MHCTCVQVYSHAQTEAELLSTEAMKEYTPPKKKKKKQHRLWSVNSLGLFKY